MFTKKTDEKDGIFNSPGTTGSNQPAPANPVSAPPSPAMPTASPAIASRTTAPTAANSPGSANPSYFGNDLTIKGNIESKGEIQIDGDIEGNINCQSLVIGEKAFVKGGNIIAEDIVVRGEVNGTIRGIRVTLESSSKFEGDVYHKTLAIEQGALFEGKSRRADDPIGSAPAIDAVNTTDNRASNAPASGKPTTLGVAAKPKSA